MTLVYPDERVDDLQYKGLRIIQKKTRFRFGNDAVLLAGFVRLTRKCEVVDLCSGSGVIPLLLWGRGGAERITGIELFPELTDMAKRSAQLCGITSGLEFLCGDVRDIRGCFSGCCDIVTVNPPYGRRGSCQAGAEAAARQETECTIDEVVSAARTVLRPGGRLYVVYKPQRLSELFCAMEANGITVKRMREVIDSPGRRAFCVLVEGRKDGGAGMELESPLYIKDASGEYTAETKMIYHMEEA